MVALYGSVKQYYLSVGISRLTEADWNAGNSTMRLSMLVSLCNRHGLYPSQFIHPVGSVPATAGAPFCPSDVRIENLRNLFDRQMGYPLGVTLAELSQELGASVSTVMGWLGYPSMRTESNNLRVGTLIDIANRYGINLDRIIVCPSRPLERVFAETAGNCQYERKILEDLERENACLRERIAGLEKKLAAALDTITRVRSIINE